VLSTLTDTHYPQFVAVIAFVHHHVLGTKDLTPMQTASRVAELAEHAAGFYANLMHGKMDPDIAMVRV
jgi:hypothetical protein